MCFFEFNIASDGFHIVIFGGERFTLFHFGLDVDNREIGGILFNMGFGIRW